MVTEAWGHSGWVGSTAASHYLMHREADSGGRTSSPHPFTKGLSYPMLKIPLSEDHAFELNLVPRGAPKRITL